MKNEVHIIGEVVRPPHVLNTGTATKISVDLKTTMGNFTTNNKIVAWNEKANGLRDLKQGDLVEIKGVSNHKVYKKNIEGKDVWIQDPQIEPTHIKVLENTNPLSALSAPTLSDEIPF